MNREEILKCMIEVEERQTSAGSRYQARLRAPQAGAILYESGRCQARDEAERRARSHWRDLLREIAPDDAPFV